MLKFSWDTEKARLLRNDSSRGNVSFEDCVIAIEEGRVLDEIQNPSSNHRSQRMFVLEIHNYAYIVPYVQSDTEIFLKTVFPSRKHTAFYLKE